MMDLLRGYEDEIRGWMEFYYLVIFPIIPSNIWQSAASLYIKEARNAAKL